MPWVSRDFANGGYWSFGHHFKLKSVDWMWEFPPHRHYTPVYNSAKSPCPTSANMPITRRLMGPGSALRLRLGRAENFVQLNILSLSSSEIRPSSPGAINGWRRSTQWVACIVAAVAAHCAAAAAERTERFDKVPAWHAHNNRATTPEPRAIRQDFGYSPTAHAGGAPGEMGGFITPAAEAAYYAKEIPNQTFDDPLSAAGKLVCAGRQFHVLVAFFNAGTLNEWRTPNTVALRLYGRGN